MKRTKATAHKNLYGGDICLVKDGQTADAYGIIHGQNQLLDKSGWWYVPVPCKKGDVVTLWWGQDSVAYKNNLNR